MKVYIVTSGCYSDYHIEKVFTDPEQARLYALLDPDRDVEEYNTDTVQTVEKRKYLLVRYDYMHDKIFDFCMYGKPVLPRPKKYYYNCFEFTVSMENERVYRNVIKYGKRSSVLKKIVQDTFATYLYEHGTSREELIRKRDKELEKERKSYYYTNYTTSVDTGQNVMDAHLTAFADKYLEENGKAPTIGEMLKYAGEKMEEEEKQ